VASENPRILFLPASSQQRSFVQCSVKNSVLLMFLLE
jgi:hypothetical protein